MKTNKAALQACKKVISLLGIPKENAQVMLADARRSPKRVLNAYAAIINSYHARA